MDWRAGLFAHGGPGMLGGIAVPDWLRLLRQQRDQIDISRLVRLMLISAQSLKNTSIGRLERHRFEKQWDQVTVLPPLFILGHWRSGTTLLHELISHDPRLGWPTTYQVSFPHIFLTAEATDTRVLSWFVPRYRPMDAMRLTLASPQEDEFALLATTLKSPCMAWVFPRQKERFARYLTLRDVDPAELSQWKQSFVRFLKKVQWRQRRPLVLKSPPHTARVRLLLEMFPQAKFIHIHRHPCRVFQSSRHSFPAMFRWHSLQRPPVEDLAPWILQQYAQMYDAYFADKERIPAGQLHELSFEALEADPIGELERAYHALGLGPLDPLRPAIQRYLDSRSNYRKNTFPDLSEREWGKVVKATAFCFEAWGYRTSRAAQSTEERPAALD